MQLRGAALLVLLLCERAQCYEVAQVLVDPPARMDGNVDLGWDFWRRVVEETFVEAHDAATGYFSPLKGDPGNCPHDKTQSFRRNATFHHLPGQYPSAFSSLLDCGARALDLRLCLCERAFQRSRGAKFVGRRRRRRRKGGKIFPRKGLGNICMHHGPSTVAHTTLESELGSIVRWTEENPHELVLLKLVPDNGAGQVNLTRLIYDELALYGIPSISRADLNGQALDGCWGKLGIPWSSWRAHRHRIIAVWKFDQGNSGQPDLSTSCVEDNFVSSIGFNPYHAERSFENLKTYAANIIHNQFRPPRQPFSSQAIFQETQLFWQTAGTEIYYDFSLTYNLLEINYKTQVNAFILNFTRSNRVLFKRANLVKLNNLCLHGPAIATSLGTRVTRAQAQRCIRACGGLNKFNPCH